MVIEAVGETPTFPVMVSLPPREAYQGRGIQDRKSTQIRSKYGVCIGIGRKQRKRQGQKRERKCAELHFVTLLSCSVSIAPTAGM